MEQLLEGLNDAQRVAVEHDAGPLLIVAGAGTGKTTVLTRRYARLVGQPGSSVERVLALTFTEKAAGEMEDRVLGLLPAGAYDFWIATFHGFCQRLLEAHALDIGLPTHAKLLTGTEGWLLLRRHINELPLEYYKPLGNPTKFLRAIMSHISRAKDEGITPERYAAFAEEANLGEGEEADTERQRLRELAAVYGLYQRLLREQGFLDFGDLILETLRLLRERPRILREYREQFTHIMVDEFQDTNWAQYELVKLLAGEQKNITVVGDDDQAIYKFRGASLANILQFRDDFPEAKTVALVENYRSKKEILTTAYTAIRKNDPNRLEVRLGIDKELRAMAGEGGEVRAIWAASDQAEAEQVVRDIHKRKQADTTLTWNDFAILVRSNDGATPFVRACERQNIPFQFLALRGLYTKPTVLDMQAILSLVDGYHESAAVWRVLGLPSYAISEKDRAECLHEARRKGVSLWQALVNVAEGGKMGEVSDAGRERVGRLVRDIGEIAQVARRRPPTEVLQAALQETGYLAHLMKGTEREKQESIQHLNGFAERMRRYETAVQDPHLRDFLEEFRLELDAGEEGALTFDAEAGPEFVRILTVHASKGLEYKHVYVVSMVDQRFPSRARPEAIPFPNGLLTERLPEGDHHIEEERRLFYVAMTRAKESLTLTGARNYGGTRDKKPSIFFGEAAVELPEETGSSHFLDSLSQAPALEDEPVSDLVHYELKKRFSFTQLAAFRKCPLQYKFEHIYRLPKIGTYQKSFGQSIHRTFEHVLALHRSRNAPQQGNMFEGMRAMPSAGFSVTDDEAREIYLETWDDQWYPDREKHDEYKKRGWEAVRYFLHECRTKPFEVLAVEKPFTLVFGKYSIKGTIDRIDQLPDGSLRVIDYKTGSAKDELKTEDKEQLHLYQLALEGQGHRVTSLMYVYVMDWQIAEVEPMNDKKRTSFLETIEGRMEAIASSNFAPTPEPFVCKYCDFKSICEFRKLN
ncbi:ATP-dependent helicase [Patescibacteria group bacterium]|nr:ATP-dependent helicase [Patescibacteria group bacterium]MDQ5919916.1 ATP-dependent helicase UvrD/PcrA [Patescibacteria group bacterium]